MEKPMGEDVREEEKEVLRKLREGEREYCGFIVMCFPTIHDTGRGAEQLNIQTHNEVASGSSCGTGLSPRSD